MLVNIIIEEEQRPPLNPDCPFNSLMEICWQKDPDQRPIFAQIVGELKNTYDSLPEEEGEKKEEKKEEEKEEEKKEEKEKENEEEKKEKKEKEKEKEKEVEKKEIEETEEGEKGETKETDC